MKTLFLTIPVFFLSLFIYTKLTGPIPFSVNQTTTNKTDLFTVTGMGKVAVSPDIARVTVGIQENGPTVKAAQDTMNTKINAVSDSIKKIGIDKKDIKTTNYSIQPNYDYANGKQNITGYSAQTNLEIIVRELEKANSVIDVATGAGANTVGGLTFDVEDKSKAENEARKLAVQEAKKKAEEASKTAGFTIGKMLNYQESFNRFGEPRPLMMAAKADMNESVQTELEPGSKDLTLTVTMSFEIR
jgi:hypothetical protein